MLSISQSTGHAIRATGEEFSRLSPPVKVNI